MIIKNIFNGIFNEEIHVAFLKFGRGEYKNKYLIEAKKQKDKYAIKTSAEFANYFVRKGLGKVSGKIPIKGVIVSTLKLEEEMQNIEIKKVSNFQGVKKVELDTEVNAQEILEMLNKYPKVFFALSFKMEGYELKIKPKAPTSGKPGKNKGEVKADFCSLKTTDESVIKDLLWDAPNFKEIKAKHTLKIENIIYPKGEEDPVKIREMSKRKGIVVREIEVDGKEVISEAEFEA